MVLPGMGIISEIGGGVLAEEHLGYSFIAFSSLAIAVIGFLVWGHHMFVAGETRTRRWCFSIITYLVGVPSAIKTFNWTATAVQGCRSPTRRDALRVRVHRLFSSAA